MNNYEKIIKKTAVEMAEFIDELSNSGEYTCSYCKYYNDYLNDDTEDSFDCDMENCIEGVKLWLLQEVSND